MAEQKLDGFLEEGRSARITPLALRSNTKWTVDWDQYTRYRPPYPPSVEKLIMDYHRAHSMSLRLAHDVGSGSGVFARRLAEYFQHVHVSDPTPAFIEQARQRLDKWFTDHWWKGRFTFSLTSGEQAHEVAAKQSVDLVTLMQCVHWIYQDQMVQSVAASLAPHGTMAVVVVHPAPRGCGNTTVDRAVQRLFEFWIDNVLESAGGKDSTMAKRFLPQAFSGVGSVRLAESSFAQEVTERIDINVHNRGTTPFAVNGYEHLAAPSRATPLHRRYEFTSDDAEGMG